jgi:glycosyltransferase involved in cell wall biosynthesis
MSQLSVIIITKNEEKNIRKCLESVRWAEEIVIVDSGSSDRTMELAKEYTKKIFVKPWEGYGEAKNFGLSKCSGDWVFWLDADERATVELQKEIQNVLKSAGPDVKALRMPRKANFLGKWIKHCGWYPGRVVRVFRRSEGKFSEERVHEKLEIAGEIIDLNSDLLHYTDPNLVHYYNKFNNYTSLAADELILKKRKFRFFNMVVNPVWVFVKMYFIKLGFLDGIQGFILCVLSAQYVFTKYAKLWELTEHIKGKENE